MEVPSVVSFGLPARTHTPVHARGKGLRGPILHRDLKPSNILLTNNRRTVKLADFGFAMEITNKRGTVLWMAPEVFTGKQYSEKCDVYSLAICMWEVLMRHLPYHDADGKGPNMTAFKNNEILWYTDVTNRDPPLRPSPMPHLSEAPELDDIIREAWAKEPDGRPTAAKMRDRLEEVMKKFSLP